MSYVDFSYVDFEDLKQRISIEAAAKQLQLKLKQEGDKFRAPCPACGDNPRSLAISGSKNVFYCHSPQKGGDQIALVAHVRECSMKDAAHWLNNSHTVPEKVDADPDRMQPLSYLEHDHELVQVIGFEPTEAEALGLGYAPKGVMRGTVAIPLRTGDGTLTGYIGITDARLPKSLKIPQSNVVPLKKTGMMMPKLSPQFNGDFFHISHICSEQP